MTPQNPGGQRTRLHDGVILGAGPREMTMLAAAGFLLHGRLFCYTAVA